jgi:hypothetical protein
MRRRSRPEREAAPEPEPAATDWAGTLASLAAAGFDHRECPALCRRKGDHLHMGSPAADLIVSPAVTS